MIYIIDQVLLELEISNKSCMDFNLLSVHHEKNTNLQKVVE